MCSVEYTIDEYGNLITKSGISLESQFIVANLKNDNKEIEVEEDDKN